MTHLTSINALRAEFDRLHARLQGRLDTVARAEVKQAIVALFRETEAAIAEYAEFKEAIRELVERFKALPAEAVPGGSVRHDHIGATTWIERGWTALAGGDWQEAERAFREAIARDATSLTAEALLGWALFYGHRYDDAMQHCLQVLVKDQDHGLARVALGAVCLRKGITGEAIEHLTRASRSAGDPRAALYANYWLGVAYLDREMAEDALEFLRRAVTLGPNLAEGWCELGRALWSGGHHAEAREAWTVGARIRHSPHGARAAALLAEHAAEEGRSAAP
jgi:tetratricopeptide (TPR) repeat protein